MVFPVVMYGCENWTVKKAENQRIDAFELWCWRRLLRVPWTARIGEDLFWKQFSCGWVTKPNLGLLARYVQQSQSTYTKLWWKKVEPLIASCPMWGWARRPSSSCSKYLNSLMALREGFLKTVWGRGLQGDWSNGKHSSGLLVVRELHGISGVNIIPSSPNWSGGLIMGQQNHFFTNLFALILLLRKQS